MYVVVDGASETVTDGDMVTLFSAAARWNVDICWKNMVFS
jgi:hypothetical protein